MGIELAQRDDSLADDEPFLPDIHARAALAQRLLPQLLAGTETQDVTLRTLARAGTEYPSGQLGELLLDKEIALLGQFAAELRAATAEPCVPAQQACLEFDLDGETWRLSGGFGDLRSGGLVRQRYDDVRAADYLAGWISHVFLCALAPAGVVAETRWYSRNGHYRLQPCAAPHELLRDWLRLYRRGLCEPVHFFPKSAWQYVVNGAHLGKAIATWRSTSFRPYGEADHPAYRLALRGCADPLDADFVACASTVFGLLRPCLEDERL